MKLSPYGPLPESGNTLYWTQPKDLTDEVVLLAIKRTDGTILLLKDKFRNADRQSCGTMHFVEPQKDYLAVRGEIDKVNHYLQENRSAFEAANEGRQLASTIKLKANAGKKGRAI